MAAAAAKNNPPPAVVPKTIAPVINPPTPTNIPPKQ